SPVHRRFLSRLAKLRDNSRLCDVTLVAEDLIGTDEFYQLPGKQLLELISSEELQVPSEEELFEHVRLPLCRPLFLVGAVSKETLVKADAVCRNLVDQAKDYHLVQLSTHEQPNMQGSLARPRRILGGETLYAEMPMPVDATAFHFGRGGNGTGNEENRLHREQSGVGVAVFDNFLYAVGGSDGKRTFKSVERFNPATGAWSNDVALMSHSRSKLGVAALDGFIYAVGGCNGFSLYSLSVVERYDPRRNQWTRTAPLRTPSFERLWDTRDKSFGHAPGALAVVNGRLYAVGGCNDTAYLDTVEVFDTDSNQWIDHSRMNKRRSDFGVGVLRMS
ncbi:kelch repeat protein, partial [Teladorsagia circumcincta]